MSQIVKEPYAPRRPRLTFSYRRGRIAASLLCRRIFYSVLKALQRSELTNEDACIMILLIALSMITLLLPWIVL